MTIDEKKDWLEEEIKFCVQKRKEAQQYEVRESLARAELDKMYDAERIANLNLEVEKHELSLPE